MKVLNFQECVGSTSSTQSASKLAFYRSKLVFTFFFESFRCSALYSSLSLEHPPLCACEFLLFSSFFPPFFFWVNNFFHFLYLKLPSLLYHLRKKIQTLWRDTKWKIWERKKKNAKSNRETRKKKEVQQFFFKFFYCFDLNRERFLDPAGSTAVGTISCFLCIERFLGSKEPDWWEGHGYSGRTVRSGPGLKTMLITREY